MSRQGVGGWADYRQVLSGISSALKIKVVSGPRGPRESGARGPRESVGCRLPGSNSAASAAQENKVLLRCLYVGLVALRFMA